MNRSKFVVAVQRKYSYQGRYIPKESRSWYYGQYDGRTNIPTFYDLRNAIHFDTVQQAQAWYEDNKDLMKYIDEYDTDTFQIQQIFVKPVINLEYEKPNYEVSLLWG